MAQGVYHVDADPLRSWVSAVFECCGVGSGDAEVAAQALVRTSLRGIDTHGIARLPAYVQRLLSREVDPQAVPRIEERHGLLRCHGGSGLGQVVLNRALAQCLRRAADTAVVTCSIEASGHLGALGVLLLPAAEAGCMAFLCQRTPPIMGLEGSTRPAIGNNPMAFAAPLEGQAPVVFDSALSTVARGHLLTAVREGQTSIPPNWALDASGRPTTDPRAALAGTLQAAAGYKGLGLAILVECLAGALRSDKPAPPGRTGTDPGGSAANASAFLMVLNPALAVGKDSFSAHMQAWVRTLVSSGTGARYPGERQGRCELERRRDGIPVTPSLTEQLQQLGRAVGQPFAFPLGT